MNVKNGKQKQEKEFDTVSNFRAIKNESMFRLSEYEL
jgi:hypothetical protein